MTEKPTEVLNKAIMETEVRKYFLIAFIPSFIYAVVRYNILKEVPWSQTPLWVTNKALAMTATILIGMAFCMPKSKPRKKIGILGFYISVIHAMMSFALLNPANYAKFFAADGRYNLTGGLVLLTGILSTAFLIWALYHSFPQLHNAFHVRLDIIHKLVLLALFFNLAHLVAMGVQGWVKPSSWGIMPPVSIVSAVLCFYFISLRLLRKNS